MTTQRDTDIQLWRTAVTRDSAIDEADADELEGHLREQIAELVAVGLSDGEAFQIAVQRLGQVDQLTAEFAREHGERLWKQLTLPTGIAAGIDRIFDRDLLIVFDVLLIVVLGLVLYALSARDATKPADPFDVLRLIAVAAAILLDLLVLGSILARIAEFGFTPNRVAALGLNVILVVNLAVTAWYLSRMLARRVSGGALERWQTRYLPVFGAWSAVVALVMPVLFAYS